MEIRGNMTPVNTYAEPIRNEYTYVCLTYAKQLKLEHCIRKVESFSYCTIKRSYKQTFTALWPKRVTVYTLQTGARPQNIENCAIYSLVEHLHFCFFEVFFTAQLTFRCRLTVSKCPLSILERCPSHREYSYNKRTEKRQELTPGVRLRKVSISQRVQLQ